tara:strand:+ start:1547 stop:2173 length:627 start_codon:yes stop_codon:yes gene_type:complete
MAARKTAAERWWDLYLNDDGCKKNFNGLHLVCAMYGDDEEDSDTVMQSMARDYHHQLFPLEFVTKESQFKESISACMWNDQYPEGFFAHLQSQLPKVRVLNLERAQRKTALQSWEEWGWEIIHCDNEIKSNRIHILINGKRLERLLTEEQRTQLETRINHYHGEKQTGKIVSYDKPVLRGAEADYQQRFPPFNVPSWQRISRAVAKTI